MAGTIVELSGALGRIRLDRPKALNALTHEMVGEIDRALDRFEQDDRVAAVALTGEGERGLCAGGDLRAISEDPDGSFAARFWRDEYRLDARIARYAKPFVAVMDGITMGGGVGVSAHAAHRLVTERSRIAMPETGIGYLPDVGGTWLLPRAPGEAGTYLGLAGAPMDAADAIHAGFADLMVRSADLPAILDALSALSPDAGHAGVRAILARFAQEPGGSRLSALSEVLDRAFAFDTVEEILSALGAEATDFAAATKATLLEKAPASLVLTLRLLRLGRAAPDLETCLEREFHASLALLAEGDFREGIRAAVIDKDRDPRWSPATLAGVDPVVIERWLTERRAEPVFPRATAA